MQFRGHYYFLSNFSIHHTHTAKGKKMTDIQKKLDEVIEELHFDNDEPWIAATGAKVSHEAFAEMAHARRAPPKIIHWGI